jgi:GAF domain-containing protein
MGILEDLEKRALQLQTAADVSRVASSVLDPDALIQQVVNLVQERFDLYYVGLFLVDQMGEWAVLYAGTGEAGQRMLEQEHRLELGSESMIGWCISHQQARIALDVGEEAVRFENPFLPDTRSELALPLISRGEAMGALSIQSVQEAAFSNEDIAVLQTMADQLANAIQNARLFDTQQSASALLGERVRALDLLNELGRRIDESPQVPNLLLWVAGHLPAATQFPGECMVAVEFEGRIYGVAEAISLPCQIVAGLQVGGEQIGQLTVAYAQEHEFRTEESALVDEIVRRLSGYIESRRLFEQTQEALRMVEATNRRYMEQAWVDYSRSTTVTAYETELPGSEPLGDALLPEVQQVVERQGVMAWTSNGGEASAHSAMVAPIVSRGVVLGALGIHDDDTRQWTQEEMTLIEAIAERVALAAENLRLLDETQRRAAREQAVAEVSSRMRETMDLETVLKVAVQELRQSLGLPEVEIRLATGEREG